MTGKYPARLGITNYLPGVHPTPYSKLIGTTPVQQLALEETTVAEALKTAGYATGQFGKWHLGGAGFTPDKQGFDYVFNPDRAAGNYFYPGWRGPGPEFFEGKPGEYITDRLGEEVSGFITRNREKPFFVYLPHFAPTCRSKRRKTTSANTPQDSLRRAAERSRVRGHDSEPGRKRGPDRQDARRKQSPLEYADHLHFG
jgi:arylsulfatase A-like enzyme